VILCDVLMPKMGGDAFFLAVESAKPHLIERFIFMTGHRENRSVENFVNRTPAPVLQKPIQIDDLGHTIRSVLRKTGRRR
jgi:DNA-binding NtrC family response regulator